MARVVLCRSSQRLAVSSSRAPISDVLEPRFALAGFTVTSTLDAGAGSLRQAILDSNTSIGADTIGFSAAFNVPQTITVITPLPQMSSDLTITGTGSSLLTVRMNAAFTPVFGVFSSTATNLTMTGMTITGANINGSGAGLQSTGPGTKTVTFDDMVFTGLTASNLGGAIALNNNTTLNIRNSVISNNTGLSGGGICFINGGSLLMENCTIRSNVSTVTTSAGGGGVYFFGNAGSLVIRNSTFDHNTSARSGGGLLLDTFAGNLSVQNSTFSDNTAALNGGAIATTGGNGSLTLQNSTIVGNTANGATATSGGGGLFRSSTLNNSISLSSTIVAGNTNSGAPDIRVDPFTTLQANFSAIGNASGFTLAAGSGNNLSYGTNLLLGPLVNNGGPTQTRAILGGSPLIDAGANAAALATDQRGVGHPRVAGSATDIGAFERAVVGPTVSSKQFLFETAPHALRFGFSENVSVSLSSNDIELRNRDTGALITVPTWSITYVAASNLATFAVSALPGNILPDGNYRATLLAAGVTNGSGVALRASETIDFHVLTGDANRDRTVNFDDLLILAQNYGTSGKTFSQGNFDYSANGTVNFDDLLLLAQRYGTSLLQMPPTKQTSRTNRAAIEPIV